MLEDDQRFEELESKLAALSSQVESLELDTELDPFSEDDVRRTIEYFKSLELAGLESEDFGGEDFEDDESSSSDDFISVQTTGGPSFKTHWIAPTSCENMTRDLARDAFVQGAADRYGTSQQVNNGDVLILLCREPVADSGSEPEESEPSNKTCRYIGLAYNTLIHPASAEPTSATEESISAPVGNYEIFVWSSCECSAESAGINVSSLSISSGSSDSNKYASIGDSASPVLDTVSGLVTDITVDNTSEQTPLDSLNSIGIGSVTLSNNSAGLKTGLVSLSEKLTDYYVNYAQKSVTLEGTKTNIDSRSSNSGKLLSKTYELTGSECGISSVSIASVSLGIFRPGYVESSHAFLDSVSVSLGVSIFNDGSIDDTNFIPSYRVSSSAYEDLTAESTVFLPVITEEMADKIENSDTLNTQSFSLTGATVTPGSSGVTVSIGTSASTITANYSSGLLTHKNSPTPSLGNISFTLPNVSIGNGNNSDINFREVTDVTVRGEYDVIYESEGTGDARYYVDHIYQDVTIDIENGLVAGSAKVSPATSYGTKPIVVPGAELRYSCDPVYGCQLDPTGSYLTSNCDGACYTSSPYALDSGGVNRTVYVASGFYVASNTEDPDLTIGGQGYVYDQAGDSSHELDLYSDNTVIVAGNHVPAVFPMTDSGSIAEIAAYNASPNGPLLSFRYFALGGVPGWSGYKQYDVFSGELVTDEDINEIFTF